MKSHEELIAEGRHDLCTEAEVVVLVHTFYGRMRVDPQLGPVFGRHVPDWDHHLAQLVDFWSGLLRGTGRYRGKPMPQHMALPELRPEMFLHWLEVFKEVGAAMGNPALEEKANRLGAMIAERLWNTYQRTHWPERVPQRLQPDLQALR